MRQVLSVASFVCGVLSAMAEIAQELSSDRYMLLLLDVLGFEARFEEEGLDAIFALYRRLTDYVDGLGGELIFDVRPSGTPGIGTPFFGYVQLEHAYFSDTILLWTHARGLSARHFLSHCNRLICHALSEGIMVRGAISAGPAILDKEHSIFLGAPIIEAARLEHGQDWIGVTLGESFLREIAGQPAPWEELLLFREHLKPDWQAKGYFADHPAFVLNWLPHWPDDKPDVKELLKSHRESAAATAQKKYSITLEFLEFAERHWDWTKDPNGFAAVYKELTGRMPEIRQEQ